MTAYCHPLRDQQVQPLITLLPGAWAPAAVRSAVGGEADHSGSAPCNMAPTPHGHGPS